MNDFLHIHNARIWTGDRAKPLANSISIRGGRIHALDPGVRPPTATIINANGRVIIPGLLDAHMHLLKGGKSLSELDLSNVRSRTQFEEMIATRHAQLPEGEWLIGCGWSQENWPGGSLPDKHWLAACGDRPAVCYRMDMHVGVVNDAVLRLCDLNRDAKGGAIGRDHQTGEPDGLMIEAALWQLVNPIVPEAPIDAKRDMLLRAQQYCHSLGLTTVGSMEYAQDVVDVFEPMRRKLTLRFRITLLDRKWPMDFRFGRHFASDQQLAIIGYKTFIDGTLGSRTARMLSDYADDPGNRGMLVELAADGLLEHWMRDVIENGFSPSMHAIGDEAARLALDAIEKTELASSLPLSDFSIAPRIEHAQQIDPADIARFRGRIASMQPLHKADDCRYVRKRMGDERIAGTFAFRSLLQAGAHLAFGSDWPVVSPDPMLGMRAAITGLTLDNEVFAPEQNLSPQQALRAYTADAAAALGLADAGVLAPHALADLVMLDRDPLTADWVNAPPTVLQTIVGGEVVYDAQPLSAAAPA
jgi:predicted amidohydrolase YtcJ